MASNQLLIKPAMKPEPEISHKAGVRSTTTETEIRIKGQEYTAMVKRTGLGGLSSLVYKGKETIFQPLIPDFARPLTDNDRRGWKPQRKLKQWYESGIKLISTGFDNTSGQEISVINEYSLINDSARVSVVYTFSGNGVIKVYYELKVKPGLTNIPKVGMQLATDQAYTELEYVGRGPMENYIDRNYGSDIGLYKQNIMDFADSYVVPQEYANRTDIRWMHLGNPKTKTGLLVVADSLLSMSAWPYTEENILNAKHTNKLVKAPYITLNIDLVQMGVGGNDSWSDVAAPLEKYQVKAKNYQYSFYIVPLNAKSGTPASIVKYIK
jgi:beta-galactosidase